MGAVGSGQQRQWQRPARFAALPRRHPHIDAQEHPARPLCICRRHGDDGAVLAAAVCRRRVKERGDDEREDPLARRAADDERRRVLALERHVGLQDGDARRVDGGHAEAEEHYGEPEAARRVLQCNERRQRGQHADHVQLHHGARRPARGERHGEQPACRNRRPVGGGEELRLPLGHAHREHGKCSQEEAEAHLAAHVKEKERRDVDHH